MADCGNGSVGIGTCLDSLFIMKHNCLENLSHDVYCNENNLSSAKCLALDESDFFSSTREIIEADGVSDACKGLHDSSDSAICSPSSLLDESDNFNKKRCMDRDDSSESSDSGILIGSTCSESSSNSGNSDITDPCSPYSVTSFHLGDDNGSPLALSSKLTSFSNDDLLAASKMLPENLNQKEENEVSCWAWDKTINWNDEYELTSHDIDVEVKGDFFRIEDKRDEIERSIKVGPKYYQTSDGKSAINGKVNFGSVISLSERKNLNSLSRTLCKNSSISVNKEWSNRKSDEHSMLPRVFDIENTQKYFYSEIFQEERIHSAATENYHKRSIKESETFSGENRNPLTITASKDIKEDCNEITNESSINSNYPLDFFNILPSVFKGPILYSAISDVEDDYRDEMGTEKTHNLVNDDHYNLLSAKLLRTDRHTNNLGCRSELKSIPDSVDNMSSKILNNNNDGDLMFPYDKSINSKLEIKASLPVLRESTRFPYDRKSSFSDRLCRWVDCVDHVASSTKLLEHLQTKHVYPQTFSGTFICLWNGCKVFGRPSCSRTFLERHVLSHGGNKPYRCIVDNCGQRFSSQLMLERHVNQHFKSPKDVNDGLCDSTPKLIRRNGQKLRYRRQRYSVRNRTDAFDAGIMSRLQYSLVQMVQRSRTVSLNIMDSKQFLNITFQPKVIGSRQEENGQTKYLIRWYPYNSLEDEWLSKSEIVSSQTIPIWELPASVQQMFWNSIFPRKSPNVHQSRKYKPESTNA